MKHGARVIFGVGSVLDLRVRVAAFFGSVATIVLLSTVCALPWIHGGTIPLARLVLQVGACVAGLFSLVSGLLERRQTGFPRIIFPLGILAGVGVLQLLPLHAPLITQMNHAVLADLRYELPQTHTDTLSTRTGSPADTRMIVAQIVALMLLAITAYDRIRSQRVVRLVLAVFTGNALIFSLLSLAQMFQGELFLIRREWWTGLGGPYGTFVNANNAAGWLSLGLAAAIGTLSMQLRAGLSHPSDSMGVGQRVLSRITFFFSRLTASQVTTWCSVILIACAVVATKSRGAMIAIGVSVLVFVLLRIQRRHVFGTIVVLGVLGLGMYFVARLLGLDELALREIRTLYDPVQAASPRVAHWKDTLYAVLDFPVLGGGLGAYRFVTLPYQSRNAGVWFQHADNQYVEFMVEAGVTGLIAFILIGLPVLTRSMHIVRSSIIGGASRTEESVALILVFATVAQAVFALFDYGIGLPAASSLFVVLVAMLTGVQDVSGEPTHRTNAVNYGMQFSLVVGGALFVSDLASAQQCYLASIAGRTVSNDVISKQSFEVRAQVLAQARQAILKRPDDPDAHETVSQMRSDLLRAEFMRGLPGIEDDDNAEKIWPLTSCLSIVRHMGNRGNRSPAQRHLHSVLTARVRNSGIVEHCRAAIRDIPVGGQFLRRAVRWDQAARADSSNTDLLTRARFSEPANAGAGLQFGEIAIRNGAAEKAEDLFAQVLRADPARRGSVLGIYASVCLLDEGLDAFGPSGYSEAIIAMRGQLDPKLIERLRGSAEKYWEERSGIPGIEDQLCRSEYLGSLKDYVQQERWLQQCVLWNPDRVRLRRELALVLERLSRPDEALVQWHEMLRIEPHNTYASMQVRRTMAAMKRRAESNE